MAPPIPVVLCGKNPAVVIPAAEKYLPEVDIVHICHTLESAKAEIPALLRGEFVVPVSGLGSNTKRATGEQRMPIAAISGGAFTTAEFEDLMKAKVRSVPWLRVELANVPQSERPPNPNYPALVVANAKKCFREHGLMDGPVKADDEGAVWDV